MDITKSLNIKSFLGVPIFSENGDLFGNLCCFDTKLHDFTDEDVKTLQTMSTFLTYVIELENSKSKAELDFERLYNENQLVLNSLSEGVVAIDKQGIVTFCNSSAMALTGFKYNKLIGRSPYDTFLRHSKREKSNFYLSLTDGLSRKADNEVFSKMDGEQFPVEYTINPTFDKGKIVNLLITFRDITERREAEELMLKSEKLTVAGELAAGIAHEIRNPLTAIKGFFQLIKSVKEKEEYYNIVESELGRIEEITSELLVLSKPQAEDFKEVNMVEVINETKLLLETQAIMKNIPIITEAECESLSVTCDKTKIKQVVINLLKNAIESMDEGTITIRIKAEQSKAIVEIVDEGPGIPKEMLHRIGEPFYTTKEKGTGLGLLICFRIIENHNGSIAVENNDGRGATFRISLPL